MPLGGPGLRGGIDLARPESLEWSRPTISTLCCRWAARAARVVFSMGLPHRIFPWVVGIDRLGRSAAEVMTTIRELRDRDIVLRSLREGIDSSNATGRMIAGVLASLAELELELGRERRAAAREARRARGQHIGRPKALDEKKTALAQRMHASGESASTIAAALGVSRATVYRVLAEQSA